MATTWIAKRQATEDSIAESLASAAVEVTRVLAQVAETNYARDLREEAVLLHARALDLQQAIVDLER